MTAALGHTAVGYAVVISMLFSLVLTARGLGRWRGGLWLAAGVLALFFCVAEALSIGLFVLSLSVAQFTCGIRRLLGETGAQRLVTSLAGGPLIAVLGVRPIA